MSADLKQVEETCRQMGRVIGKAIDAEYGRHQVGFCLLLFDFGEHGHLTYLSNAERETMVRALREFITMLQTHR